MSMNRYTLSVLLGLYCANPAHAADCPAAFSYVDLGQVHDNGKITPGGPVFRVARDGQTLLKDPQICHRFSDDAQPLTDGAGQLMPFVPGVAYDPALVAANLDSVSVSGVSGNASRLADMNTPLRDAMQSDPNIDRTTGAGFTCYSLAYDLFPSAVCDLDNPFDSTTPIVMSCENGNCAIIQITMSPDLIASADWDAGSVGYDSPFSAGQDGASIVSNIHRFLTDQMAN